MDERLRAALALHHAGRLTEAAARYRELLRDDPGDAGALHMLGMACHQLGQGQEALAWLDRAVAAAPGTPEVLANRAAVHLAMDDATAAARDAQAAILLAPAHFGAWLNLGLARQRQDGAAGAVRALRHASRLRPQHAAALLHWFAAAAASAELAGVAARVREPLPALDGLRGFVLEVADALETAGSSTAALALLARLRADLPQDAEVAARLAVEAEYRRACELEYLRRSDDAMAAAADLLARAPRHRGARLLRAELARERGEIDAALGEYARLLQDHPGDAIGASSRLIALQHAPQIDAATLADEHVRWGRSFAPAGPAQARSGNDADPERPLRIGWLSPRFCAGVVETFFAAAFEALDRAGLEHVLYDNGSVEDAANARFRVAAGACVRVDGLVDEELGERIREDRIDVLVELSGHGPGNRLRALASHPAPVQVSWLDYFHSTGVDAVDFMFSDERLSPPALAANYTERLLYLPSGRLCYAPSVALPPVRRRTGGRLRFASFNRVAKMNDRVLALWARILAAHPGAVLRLKAGAFDDAQMRARFIGRCAGVGLDPACIELSGYGSHADVLAAYADVDIALDPFPFSGCATSCDALAMGVPVVTWQGTSMAGRQTAGLLETLGLRDCIATDADGYFARAAALAADTARSAGREDLAAHARRELGNVPRHAHELAAALRQAWRLHCADEA